MITSIITNYIRQKALDLSYDLKKLETKQISWKDVYEKISCLDVDLIKILRQNIDHLNIDDIRKPFELPEINLGLLDEKVSGDKKLDPDIIFPSDNTQ